MKNEQMEKLKQIEKLNTQTCFTNFKNFIIDDFSLEDLIKISLSCELYLITLRSIMWKIYLSVLPSNNNMESWIIKTINNRKHYKKAYNDYNKIKQFKRDPLNPLNSK